MTDTALTAPAGTDATGYEQLRPHRSREVLVNIRSGSPAARAAAVALLLVLAAAPALTTATTITTAAQSVGSQDVHYLAGGELWGG